MAASLGLTAAFAHQSGSALGGQPGDELGPLRAKVAVLAARYTEHHRDVVKATRALEQRTVVVAAWQCLEGAHRREVTLTTKACASHGGGLSAVNLSLMDLLIEGRDMADWKKREQAWSTFRLLSSYYESMTRRWPAGAGDLYPRLSRIDWLLLIKAMDRVGDSDGARRESAKFERQSPADWFDCPGPLQGEAFLAFMSARLADVEEFVWDPFVLFSPQQAIDELRKTFERCATESLGWSAADAAAWVRPLNGRQPGGFQGSRRVVRNPRDVPWKALFSRTINAEPSGAEFGQRFVSPGRERASVTFRQWPELASGTPFSRLG